MMYLWVGLGVFVLFCIAVAIETYRILVKSMSPSLRKELFAMSNLKTKSKKSSSRNEEREVVSSKKNKIRKTEFPLARDTFMDDEEVPATLSVKIGERTIILAKKQFSTGSLGFHASEKISLETGGEEVKYQLGFLLTAVGSKEAE